jgi:hypothetical protein
MKCFTVALGHLFVYLSLSGCSMAMGQHESLPGAQYAPAREGSSVELYGEGVKPPKACIRIASLAAHGNGYANRATLENTLRQEGEQVGAGFVVVTGMQVTKDETVGTYGRGIMMADTIQRPHLYGIACRKSRVRLGVNFSKDGQWTIEYVYPNSHAERLGLKEGDRLLSVNGIYLPDDKFALEREALSKAPGDKVLLEWLPRNGEKIKKDVILEAGQ